MDTSTQPSFAPSANQSPTRNFGYWNPTFQPSCRPTSFSRFNPFTNLPPELILYESFSSSYSGHAGVLPS
jgi:hypothetical protein